MAEMNGFLMKKYNYIDKEGGLHYSNCWVTILDEFKDHFTLEKFYKIRIESISSFSKKAVIEEQYISESELKEECGIVDFMLSDNIHLVED